MLTNSAIAAVARTRNVGVSRAVLGLSAMTVQRGTVWRTPWVTPPQPVATNFPEGDVTDGHARSTTKQILFRLSTGD